MRYYYFVCEGAHDAAVVGRVLQLEGFSHTKSVSKLDSVWRTLLPKQFPYETERLGTDLPVPYFYRRGDKSVAVRMAGGVGKLLDTLDDDLSVLRVRHLRQMKAIGILLDGDDKNAVETRNWLTESVDAVNRSREKEGDEPLCFSKRLLSGGRGEVYGVPVFCKTYVFPDNEHQGTLEDMLLSAVNIVHPELPAHALAYVKGAGRLARRRLSPSHRNKAGVGCIANIFRPGKSNQISIYLDDWICPRTQQENMGVGRITRFIRDVIDT